MKRPPSMLVLPTLNMIYVMPSYFILFRAFICEIYFIQFILVLLFNLFHLSFPFFYIYLNWFDFI